jgi:ornithine carbamoyltransferase
MKDHLLTLLEWTTQDIEKTLDLAKDSKKKPLAYRPLEGKSIALYFEKPSLRTITTFQVGIHQLGGQVIHLDKDSIGLGKRESIQDVSKCLSRWIHGLVVRCFEQDLVKQLSQNTVFPIINALTDDYHPCQALALAQTLNEHWNEQLKGKTIVFVGDGNNVAVSIAIMAAHLGMNFCLSHPEGYAIKPEIQAKVESVFESRESSFSIEKDPQKAVSQANLIYADVWASMGQEDETEERAKVFTPYQINQKLVDLAPKGCLVSHCLPAHRGEEITSEVVDSDYCICFDEAENRLHAQKGVLRHLYV